MDDSFYLSAASFSEAEHRSESYHWLGHIPFAFWIVEATQPDLIVELGTHTGNSYFSFCQAVRQLGLETSCCAVDTWAGDLHCRYCGEETYERVSKINRRKYLPFSRLIRSTFDEALSQFQDRSIDMLHIDGLRTYDALKHEFESWHPKLTDRAVVLLHDTSVFEKDFGISRYFHELSQDLPTFQFLHCGGLGVVGVGRRLPDRVARLLDVAEGGPQCHTIRRCYSRLGQRISEAWVRNGAETTNSRLQKELTGAHARFSESHRSRSDSRHQSIELWTRLESTQARVNGIVETNGALAAEKTALMPEKAALAAENTELIGENAALIGANTTLATAIARLAEEKAALTTAKIAFTNAMAALKDLNTKLKATNVDLSTENAAFAVENAAFAAGNAALAAENAAFAAGNAALTAENAAFAAGNAALVAEKAALAAKHDQLSDQMLGIQESLSWRLIHKCKAIRKRVLREGTISERCWRLFSRFAKTAMRKGLYAAGQSAARKIKHKSEDLARRGTQAVIAGDTLRSQSAVQFLGPASSQDISPALDRAANTEQSTIEVGAGDSIQSPEIVPESPEVVCDYFDPRPVVDRYDAWRDRNRDNGRRRRRFDRVLARMSSDPYFSVIVPVHDPSLDVLDAMIASVIDQTCQSWELVVVEDASTDSRVHLRLEEWASRDRRIRVILRDEIGNISAATNQASEAARGEFVVLLDNDDLLDPDALAHLAVQFEQDPEIDIIYSDHDQVESDGRYHSPEFKPGWSPELLLSFCYTAHLTAVRNRLYHEIGGMRPGFEGSQDHDFWLRASEKARRIEHIPQILYHRRVLPGLTASGGNAKPASFEAGRRAVEDAFHRRRIPCTVEQPDWALEAGHAIFSPVMPDDGPSVAIVIPSKNHDRLLERLITSLEKTTYRNYQVYIIHNASVDAETLDYFARIPHHVLTIPNPDGGFSFSALNNAAAAMVEEELILFLNDDTEVIEPRWLSQMVGWSRLEGVGAVGARLLYTDQRLQHAGMVQGLHDGHVEHAFRCLPASDHGYMALARVTRNCLAVTAACMLTPRKLFLSNGGFDEDRFAVVYNDPDYCYRLIDAGYRCVYCGEAELFHFEGRTRGLGNDDIREVTVFREVHGRRTDPYFSPHLDPNSPIFEVRPNVVPVHARPARIPLLAVTHTLDCDGAPLAEFELLSRLKASGSIDPVVLSPHDGPLREDYERAGIPVEIEPVEAHLSATTRYEALISRLARRMNQGGFDVVHANTLVTFWAVDAARRAGVPSVWSIHESERWETYYDHLPKEIGSSALSCMAYPYRVVFCSRASSLVWDALESTWNHTLIRSSIDAERFRAKLGKADRSQARQQIGLRTGEICVLQLGTVCERKGQHDLVHAFAALPPESASRMKCIVVGARDTPYSQELRRKAKELPGDRRDRFQIIDATSETADYWLAADVFCCTSRIESYPRVIQEAMACNLPIITTPAYGIAEQIRPEINALTYQPGDVSTLIQHLDRLTKDGLLRLSLAKCSPWVLRSLPSFDEMIEKYRETFVAASESAVPGWDESFSPTIPRILQRFSAG
jgi:O-antigen biosynthesis protein